MPEDVSQEQTVPAATQTENEQPTQPAGEISSLARLRAAQQASSPAAQPAPQAGEPAPTSGQPTNGQERSEFIPRPRFDEVNQRMQAAEAQLAAYRAQAPYQPPTGMQPVPQYAPQPTTMGGMAQPAQQPQQAAPAINWDDPSVVQKWQERIANDGVTALREFTQAIVQEVGAPLLEQFQQQVLGQLAPIQQSYVGQQLQSYMAQKASDPSWGQVAPHFQQLAQQAIARGYPASPDVLSVVETIARQQVGVPFYTPPAQAPVTPPFTERPGAGGQNLGQGGAPQLTPREHQMAQAFGMTDQQWAARRAEQGRNG